jgi:hypothetical protein
VASAVVERPVSPVTLGLSSMYKDDTYPLIEHPRVTPDPTPRSSYSESDPGPVVDLTPRLLRLDRVRLSLSPCGLPPIEVVKAHSAAGPRPPVDRTASARHEPGDGFAIFFGVES